MLHFSENSLQIPVDLPLFKWWRETIFWFIVWVPEGFIGSSCSQRCRYNWLQKRLFFYSYFTIHSLKRSYFSSTISIWNLITWFLIYLSAINHYYLVSWTMCIWTRSNDWHALSCQNNLRHIQPCLQNPAPWLCYPLPSLAVQQRVILQHWPFFIRGKYVAVKAWKIQIRIGYLQFIWFFSTFVPNKSDHTHVI